MEGASKLNSFQRKPPSIKASDVFCFLPLQSYQEFGYNELKVEVIVVRLGRYLVLTKEEE